MDHGQIQVVGAQDNLAVTPPKDYKSPAEGLRDKVSVTAALRNGTRQSLRLPVNHRQSQRLPSILYHDSIDPTPPEIFWISPSNILYR